MRKTVRIKSYVRKGLYKFKCLSKAIAVTNKLPDEAVAHKMLETFWPDVKSSCYSFEAYASGGEYTLSVIIPVYNSEEFLEKCLRSILTQKTEYSYEVVIVNDGSTDTSGRIIADMATTPNVVVINQDNCGYSGARNAGINAAKGEYLMFVDSDDVLLPGAIEALMKCALVNVADVVAGNYIKSYGNDSFEAGSNYSDSRVVPMGTFYGQPWGKVYRRNFFARLRFPEKYWFEDSIFAQILWPMASNCYTVKEEVYEYYINPKGISHSSAGKPKSVESLYITEQLLKDKAQFGIKITEEDYPYFLRMVCLTKYRTNLLDDDIQKCIFVAQRQLRQKYFSNFSTTNKYAGLEKALQTGNYRKYCLLCEIL